MEPRRFVLTLAAALVALSGAAAADEPEGQDPNRCAHVEGKPVYKDDGFRHVVRVRNTCTQVVTCEVWTSVDEQTTATLSVPAHAQRETVLKDGSPVSLFRAKGKCAFSP